MQNRSSGKNIEQCTVNNIQCSPVKNHQDKPKNNEIQQRIQFHYFNERPSSQSNSTTLPTTITDITPPLSPAASLVDISEIDAYYHLAPVVTPRIDDFLDSQELESVLESHFRKLSSASNCSYHSYHSSACQETASEVRVTVVKPEESAANQVMPHDVDLKDKMKSDQIYQGRSKNNTDEDRMWYYNQSHATTRYPLSYTSPTTPISLSGTRTISRYKNVRAPISKKLTRVRAHQPYSRLFMESST
jgi:hypothetical protein